MAPRQSRGFPNPERMILIALALVAIAVFGVNFHLGLWKASLRTALTVGAIVGFFAVLIVVTWLVGSLYQRLFGPRKDKERGG